MLPEGSRTQPLTSSRDDDAASGASTSRQRRRSSGRRQLGTAAVLAIVFFNVSGGPLGSEPAIRDGGPLLALASFAGFALLYSVPQALITAELSSAFPDNGGYSLWVDAAFGNFWALQESYWSWFSGVVDSAIYPVILYSAAAQIFDAHSGVEAVLSEQELGYSVANATLGGGASMMAKLRGGAAPAAFGHFVGPTVGATAADGALAMSAAAAARDLAGKWELAGATASRSAASRPPFGSVHRVLSTDRGGASAGAGGAGSGTGRNLFLCMDEGVCVREYGLKLLLIVLFAVPNVLSSEWLGKGLVVLALFVMAPYALLSALALRRARLERLWMAPRKRRLGKLLSVVYWNLSGFDSVSTFAGEISNPHVTMPKALVAGVFMMLLSYMVPLLSAALADPGWPSWHDGALTGVAQLVGGRWLAGWVLCSALLSNWGLFSSELLEDSFQLLGMSEEGLAPPLFARRHSRLDTPVNAIALQLLIIALLVGFDFEAILCIDNFFSAASALLEFAAALELRRAQSERARPFRIPTGLCGLSLLLLTPSAISLAVLYVTAAESRVTLAVIVGALLLGVGLNVPLRHWRPRWAARSRAALDPDRSHHFGSRDCGEYGGGEAVLDDEGGEFGREFRGEYCSMGAESMR